MPDYHFRYRFEITCLPEERDSLLDAVPPNSLYGLSHVEPNLTRVSFTLTARGTAMLMRSLRDTAPNVLTAMWRQLSARKHATLSAPPTPTTASERQDAAFPGSSAPPGTLLLQHFKWFIHPRDREDVLADLRTDAHEMRKSGCSQAFIITCVLWHLLICLAQYARSSLFPQKARDRS